MWARRPRTERAIAIDKVLPNDRNFYFAGFHDKGRAVQAAAGGGSNQD
jgi:hypothetical protein